MVYPNKIRVLNTHILKKLVNCYKAFWAVDVTHWTDEGVALGRSISWNLCLMTVASCRDSRAQEIGTASSLCLADCAI